MCAMHMSREPQSNDRSVFATLTRGRGWLISLVLLLLGLIVSGLFVFQAMRSPGGSGAATHVSGPR
ncbi:MAG: hypothetical protein JWM80_2513 [Cyanobacteria bacterium RYN_339]|nr:hypothetical protein [Cyanobacteria bacterium RYN_339]